MSLKSTLFKIGAAITKPAVIVTAAVTNPINFIKEPKETVKKFTEKPLTSQLVAGAITGVTLGTVAGLGAAKASLPVVLASKAPAAIKTAAIAHPVIAGAAVLATPAAVIAVAKSPKLQEKILNLPETYIETSVDVGTETAKIAEGNYTLDDGIAFLKAHPYLTAATAAAALTAAGFAAAKIAGIIAAYYQTSAAKKYLEEGTIPETVTVIPSGSAALPAEKAIATNEALPVTNATTTITTGKRKRRRAKAAITPSMRQNTQIILNNRSIGSQITNKRYLNARLLA